MHLQNSYTTTSLDDLSSPVPYKTKKAGKIATPIRQPFDDKTTKIITGVYFYQIPFHLFLKLHCGSI